MSAARDRAGDPGDVLASCIAKATAELDAAAGGTVRWSGAPVAEIALLKGLPGPGDTAAGRALAGPDGEAATKALEALGLDPEWFAACTRPEGVETGPTALATVIEAVDPAVVIALDREAAADVARAAGLQRLEAGKAVEARGRAWLAVDGLEASLADEALKKRVWRQLQAVRRAAQGGGTEK